MDDRRHGDPGCLGAVRHAWFSPAGSASDPSTAADWNCPGFSRLGEPRFKLGNAPLGRLKALPQRADQGILLGVAQVVEVGKLRHAPG